MKNELRETKYTYGYLLLTWDEITHLAKRCGWWDDSFWHVEHEHSKRPYKDIKSNYFDMGIKWWWCSRQQLVSNTSATVPSFHALLITNLIIIISSCILLGFPESVCKVRIKEGYGLSLVSSLQFIISQNPIPTHSYALLCIQLFDIGSWTCDHSRLSISPCLHVWSKKM